MLISYLNRERYTTFNKEIVPIPYKTNRNPSKVPVEEVFRKPEDGTNCELLAQAIVRARGFILPQGIRSSELYEDAQYTLLVEDLAEARTGDLIGLCPSDKTDYRGIHVGVLSFEQGELYVIHNARHEGAAQIQKLGDVIRHPKYRKVAWIKRPIAENPELKNPSGLKQLGLGFFVEAAGDS